MSQEFMKVLNEKGCNTGILMIRRLPKKRKLWTYLTTDFPVMGITCHRDFPKENIELITKCRGWCHCFRKPFKIFPKGTNLAKISRSDFLDPEIVKPQNKHKTFDFAYACRPGTGQRKTKNLKLFLDCLPILINDMSLRGIFIGRKNGVPKEFRDRVKCVQESSRSKVFKYINNSKCLFLPNELDASPRMLTEALCLDVPVIVNERILGGWKYVNPDTGSFFSSVDDIGGAFDKILSGKVGKTPRKWFKSKYGPKKSGKRLLKFAKSIGIRTSGAKRLEIKT
jgi:hypothetical protein